MNVVNCHQLQSKWKNYLNGECSPKEEQKIEEHLRSCPQCEKLLTEELTNQENHSFSHTGEKKRSQVIDDLPVQKQSKLIRKAKWKNRIMNALTIFGLIVLISILSSVITGGYYFLGGDNSKAEKASLVVKTATQMTMPNVYVGGLSLSSNVFFNMEMEGELRKELGNENKAIGKLNGKLLFNLLDVNRDWLDGQYNVKLFFQHPEFVKKQAASEQQFYKENLNETWETLNILPEGTVSEMAISFDNLYKIDDIYEILSAYDLNIHWYAIDTGTESQNDSPYLSATSGIMGIHEASVFEFEKDGGSIQLRGEGEKREEVFKKGLRLLKDNKKMVNRYIWSIEENGSLDEMYNYVNKNGVKTYGVVVSGPTKVLLKMQGNEHIIYTALGEVDFWNWYNRPAGGTIYY